MFVPKNHEIIGQRHFRITDGRDIQKRSPPARKLKQKSASIVSLRLVGNAIGPSHVYSTTNSSEYVVWQCFMSIVVEVGSGVPRGGGCNSLDVPFKFKLC